MWSGESLLQFAFGGIIGPLAFLLDIIIHEPFTWAHSKEVVKSLNSRSIWEGVIDIKLD